MRPTLSPPQWTAREYIRIYGDWVYKEHCAACELPVLPYRVWESYTLHYGPDWWSE